jgi:hypothetical protein
MGITSSVVNDFPAADLAEEIKISKMDAMAVEWP